MMDPIAAMLGLGLEDDKKAQLLAEQLRGRKQAADFFGATTVPTIAAGAQAEGKDVMDAAQRGGTLVNARKAREATEKLQVDRLAESERVRALNRTLAVADDKRNRKRTLSDAALARSQKLGDLEDANYEADLGEDYTTFVNPEDPTDTVTARMQGGEWINQSGLPVGLNLGGKIPLDDYKDLTEEPKKSALPYATSGNKKWGSAKERGAASEAGEKANVLNALTETFDEGWDPLAPGFAPVQQVHRWLATSYPDTVQDDTGDKFRWWANYQKYIENPERNKMFGATLTDNELKTWNKSSVNESMAPEYVAHRLEFQQQIADSVAEKQMIQAVEMGASINDAKSRFPTVDVEEVLAKVQDGSYWEERELKFKVMDDALEGGAQGSKPVEDMTIEELEAEANS